MKIVNIVASGSIGCRIDLKDLATRIDGFEYNSKKYFGGYLKIGDYKATIYSTGKYIIYGIKSIKDVDKTFNDLKSLLCQHISLGNIETPKIRNIVATSNIGCNLDLNKLFVNLSPEYDISYEPESFPGCVLKLTLGTVMFYSNGKYILLGSSSISELNTLEEQALAAINPYL